MLSAGLGIFGRRAAWASQSMCGSPKGSQLVHLGMEPLQFTVNPSCPYRHKSLLVPKTTKHYAQRRKVSSPVHVSHPYKGWVISLGSIHCLHHVGFSHRTPRSRSSICPAMRFALCHQPRNAPRESVYGDFLPKEFALIARSTSPHNVSGASSQVITARGTIM